MPGSFSGTTFSRHKSMTESGEVEGDFSNVYFFLSATTDRSEQINQYLKDVSVFQLTSLSLN